MTHNFKTSRQRLLSVSCLRFSIYHKFCKASLARHIVRVKKDTLNDKAKINRIRKDSVASSLEK